MKEGSKMLVHTIILVFDKLIKIKRKLNPTSLTLGYDIPIRFFNNKIEC